MIVLKFGGTSVNSSEGLTTICGILKKEQTRKPLVVVSALRGITDMLLCLVSRDKDEQTKILQEIENIHIQLVQDFFREIPLSLSKFFDSTRIDIQNLLQSKEKTNALQDTIVSFGEILSAHIIAAALRTENISSVAISATQCIVTNSNFGSADFIPEKTKAKIERSLVPLIEKNIVPVVTGFIGATVNGQTTTLGRGGSDYSATIIASCLQAEEIQFWKDVDGIYTADPHTTKNAQLITMISYQEACNLTMNGAKILHPRTILPIHALHIPIRVRNTFHPNNVGTLIQNTQENFL